MRELFQIEDKPFSFQLNLLVEINKQKSVMCYTRTTFFLILEYGIQYSKIVNM